MMTMTMMMWMLAVNVQTQTIQNKYGHTLSGKRATLGRRNVPQKRAHAFIRDTLKKAKKIHIKKLQITLNHCVTCIYSPIVKDIQEIRVPMFILKSKKTSAKNPLPLRMNANSDQKKRKKQSVLIPFRIASNCHGNLYFHRRNIRKHTEITESTELKR